MNILACPDCKTNNSKLLTKNTSWSETELFFTVNYGLRICNSCELLYAAPLEPQTLKGIEAYLTQSYNTHRVDDYCETINRIWGAGLKGLLRRRLRIYKTWLSREGRIPETLRILKSQNCQTVLDVGCSFGDFVVSAIDAGFDAYGIEPNVKLVDAISRVHQGRVFHGLFPSQIGPLPAYDAIVFLGVFYSLPPSVLRPVFDSCFRLLTAGGRLIVFDYDSANRSNLECLPTMQGPLTLSLIGAEFMRRVAADFRFARYEKIVSKGHPFYCYHVLEKSAANFTVSS